MNDKQVRNDVIAELDWAPEIDSSGIAVAVQDGVVTPSGHVPSFAQKEAAERRTRHIRGVRGIAQELVVRRSEDPCEADDEIAKRSLRLLDWDVSLPVNAIQVKVQDGWVTLAGQVSRADQKDAAEERIRNLSGVIGISNLIRILGVPARTDIQRSIEKALERYAQFESEKIRVQVENGKVILQGNLHSFSERDALENAVSGMPGVIEVDDRVVVG